MLDYRGVPMMDPCMVYVRIHEWLIFLITFTWRCIPRRIQRPCQRMIGVYNHLINKALRFHCHSQEVIGCLGAPFLSLWTTFFTVKMKKRYLKTLKLSNNGKIKGETKTSYPSTNHRLVKLDHVPEVSSRGAFCWKPRNNAEFTP